MAYERIKTEHAGAKNGGGAWMTRAEAKQTAKRQRRQADEIETALSTEERDNHWATTNAREAIREEQW
jgi:riboflavin biosynthesis pyrimidine reductase